MTHSLRNDQKFIESIILYEVNNWTPIDKISENLHKLIGEEHVENGRKLDSNSSTELSADNIANFLKEVDMKDVDTIQNGQEFIQSLILYETRIGKEKEHTYKNLCRNIGPDAIDYPMFSHLYDRFKNRYFDTDDNSLGSKSPAFSELPVDVIEVVVEKLELKEQLCLRKVSRNLRAIVDEQKPAYKNIEFNFNPNHVHIKFNDENVMYCDTGFDVDSHRSLKILRELNEIQIIKSNDYVDTAFNDFAVALKNSKLQLECLEFEYRPFNVCSTEYVSGYQNAIRIYKKIENLLKTLDHKISVKNFSMRVEEQSQLMVILPYLMPKALKTINLCDDYAWKNYEYNIDEIVAMDQWKHAKSVTISGLISAPIEKFLHLNDFTVKLNFVSIEDLIRIRDEVLTSNEFQYCELMSEVMPSFAEISRVFDFKRVIGNSFGYCPIPHSIKRFEFKITDWSISIERKSFY